MTLTRAVSAGTLVGAAAALAIYAAAGPEDLGRVAAPAAPTSAPVPTPTVTQLADCVAPAVLEEGVCVTTKPGPVVVVPDPAPRAPATTPRNTAPTTTTAVPDEKVEVEADDHEDEPDDEHEDDDGRHGGDDEPDDH